MRIIPDADFKAKLVKLGHSDMVKGFTVDDAEYAKHMAEIKAVKPGKPDHYYNEWAAYAAYTHPGFHTKPTYIEDLDFDNIRLWVWRIAMLATLVIIAIRV